jgi:hypothetical protein
VIRYVPWGKYVVVPWEFERTSVLVLTVEVDDSLEESLAVLEVAGACDDVRLDTDVSDELEAGGVEELGSCELEAEGSGVELEGGGVELVDGSGVVVGELLGSDVVVGLVLDVLAVAEPPSEFEDDIVIVWLLSLNVLTRITRHK